MSIGFKLFLYLTFFKFIFPCLPLTKADPCLAILVGLTQSNVSIPSATKSHISLGSPMPSKCTGRVLSNLEEVK